MMGPPCSDICYRNLQALKLICKDSGVPLAWENVEGLTTLLTFLGVVLDTCKLEIRFPEDKLSCIHIEICSWLGKKKGTKYQILSLVGSLYHAIKVVRPGRSFVLRMYATAARVKELDFYVKLGKEF